MVFSKEEDGKHRFVVNFAAYSQSLGVTLAAKGYTLDEPYDVESHNDFGSLALFENSERFHMIVNSEGGTKATDYFFTLDGLNIKSVYSDVLSKSSTPVAPNMKTLQAFGYD